MVKGLYIGRFQPFHNGHLWAIKHAFENVDELVVGIGSAQEKGVEHNPFSVDDRERMIRSVFEAEGISGVTIVRIPDINDAVRWISYVEQIVGEFDVLISGDGKNQDLFSEAGYKLVKLPRWEGESGTRVRKLIRENGDWKKHVPKSVANYIVKNNLVL